MSEKLTLDLDRWTGSTSDELGYTSPSLFAETHRFKDTNGQEFNVLEIDGRKEGTDGPTILSSTSFDYRIEDLLERRMAILATHKNARVLLAEIPGVTMDRQNPFNTKGAWQTPKQTLFASMGDFDLLAEQQLRAIDATVGLEEGMDVQLFGESLGAYAVVAMARVMAQRTFNKGLRVTQMDLVEPVNAYGNHTFIRQALMLKNLATIEDTRRAIYLDEENARIGHGDIVAFEKQSEENMRIDKHVKLRQIPATYLTGAGLSKGLHTALTHALANTDNDGPQLRDADIFLSRAVDSTVSFEKDLASAANTIRENGGHAFTYSLEAADGDKTPIGHHILNSLGRLASYAELRTPKA